MFCQYILFNLFLSEQDSCWVFYYRDNGVVEVLHFIRISAIINRLICSEEKIIIILLLLWPPVMQ